MANSLGHIQARRTGFAFGHPYRPSDSEKKEKTRCSKEFDDDEMHG